MHRFASPKIIVYLFFWLIVDLCLIPALRVEAVRPVCLYLAVLYAAFEWHGQHLFTMALAVGILRDLTGSEPLGVETAVLGLSTLALHFFVPKLDRRSFTIRFVVTLVFVFLVLVADSVLASLLGAQNRISWYFLYAILNSALATAILMPFVFSLSGRWFGDRAPLKQYELFR